MEWCILSFLFKVFPLDLATWVGQCRRSNLYKPCATRSDKHQLEEGECVCVFVFTACGKRNAGIKKTAPYTRAKTPAKVQNHLVPPTGERLLHNPALPWKKKVTCRYATKEIFRFFFFFFLLTFIKRLYNSRWRGGQMYNTCICICYIWKREKENIHFAELG